MKCINCNNDIKNGSKFCEFCGSPVMNQPAINNSVPINQNTIPVQNNFISNNGVTPVKKKKEKRGCLFAFLFIILTPIILVIGFVVWNKVSNYLAQREYEKYYSPTTVQLLQNDYENNKIDVNVYVNELINYVYNEDELDEKYKSKNINIVTAPHISEIVEDNIDKINNDTLKYFYEEVSLSSMQIGNSTGVKPISFIDQVDASDGVEHHLDKVVLSSNKNFLIWYTTTGEDKITDEEARQIADTLETTVKEYKKLTGIDFKYDPVIEKDAYSYDGLMDVLENNNIDSKYIKTAMGIYVMDFSDGGTLAQHVRLENHTWVKILNGLANVSDKMGAINYPYIVIDNGSLSSYETLVQVTNHELFHHYQSYYCGNGSYGTCKGDSFINEATANWASARVSNSKNNDNFLNGWATNYVSSTSSDIDSDFGGGTGYAGFVFLEHYSNNVENGTTKILDAMRQDNSLKYLEENSALRNVAINSLAISNLTNSYTNKAFYSNKKVTLEDKLCNSMCVYDSTINKGAIKYYEISKSEYKHDLILELSSTDDVNYLIVNKDNNVPLKSGNVVKEQIKLNDYIKNNSIYIVVYNNSFTKDNNYKLAIISNRVVELLTDSKDLVLGSGDIFEFTSSDCVQFETDSFFDLISNFLNLGSRILTVAKDYSTDDELNNLFDNEKNNLNSINDQLQGVKKEVGNRVIKICQIPLDSNKTSDELHNSNLNLINGPNFKVFDQTQDGVRTTVRLGYDINTLNVKAYALSTSINYKTLYLVEIK